MDQVLVLELISPKITKHGISIFLCPIPEDHGAPWSNNFTGNLELKIYFNVFWKSHKNKVTEVLQI